MCSSCNGPPSWDSQRCSLLPQLPCASWARPSAQRTFFFQFSHIKGRIWLALYGSHTGPVGVFLSLAQGNEVLCLATFVSQALLPWPIRMGPRDWQLTRNTCRVCVLGAVCVCVSVVEGEGRDSKRNGEKLSGDRMRNPLDWCKWEPSAGTGNSPHPEKVIKGGPGGGSSSP